MEKKPIYRPGLSLETKEFAARVLADPKVLSKAEERRARGRYLPENWVRDLAILKQVLDKVRFDEIGQSVGVSEKEVSKIYPKVIIDLWAASPSELQQEFPLHEVARGIKQRRNRSTGV